MFVQSWALNQFQRDHLSEYDHLQFDMTMTILIPHTSSKLLGAFYSHWVHYDDILVIQLQFDLVAIPGALYATTVDVSG